MTKLLVLGSISKQYKDLCSLRMPARKKWKKFLWRPWGDWSLVGWDPLPPCGSKRWYAAHDHFIANVFYKMVKPGGENVVNPAKHVPTKCMCPNMPTIQEEPWNSNIHFVEPFLTRFYVFSGLGPSICKRVNFNDFWYFVRIQDGDQLNIPTKVVPRLSPLILTRII